MKEQYKIPLVLFLFGMVITIIGSLFKIMHWPYSNLLLIFGMISEILAIFIVIRIILKPKK
ncbi:GldL-related protein [Flavobacterium sp. HNIBRBA15423]|uniref:GldL-related protein n=1 Tax=Flavobacterium sp. HNIBRBA15423 TaxID=3458683 RepID=UPI004043DF0A